MFDTKTRCLVGITLTCGLLGLLSTPTEAEGFPEILTIGVFEREDDASRIADRDLVMEVGVPCFTWARKTGPDGHDSEDHWHYNAADESSHVAGTFTWTEYGPAHSEEELHDLCASGKGGTTKQVGWTSFFEEQHGDRDPYYLKLISDDCPEIEHLCIEVGEYQGPNAIPPVTMQVLPSSGGDTVTNDAENPPGGGAQVVVGFWERGGDYEPAPGENPCAGEPTMKIAYPVEYGRETCYGWNHWVTKHGDDGEPWIDNHPNSAKNFQCDENGDLTLTQWTTMTCRFDEPMANCRKKGAARTYCCRDNPPEIWSQILSGCGKEPPGVR